MSFTIRMQLTAEWVAMTKIRFMTLVGGIWPEFYGVPGVNAPCPDKQYNGLTLRLIISAGVDGAS